MIHPVQNVKIDYIGDDPIRFQAECDGVDITLYIQFGINKSFDHQAIKTYNLDGNYFSAESSNFIAQCLTSLARTFAKLNSKEINPE